jgi:caa(3)-type oxidase subunit IV
MADTTHSHAARYVATWGALLVLTTATLLLSFDDHGTSGLAIAFAFATTKAVLVAWIFMHLSEQPLSSRLALVAGVLLAVLLVGLVVGDVALRPDLGVQVPVRR